MKPSLEVMFPKLLLGNVNNEGGIYCGGAGDGIPRQRQTKANTTNTLLKATRQIVILRISFIMPRAARPKKIEPLREDTSLEFHVDKCGERYKQMNEKLDNLSKRIEEESKSSDHKFDILFRKVDDIMMKMHENQASQHKMLMGLLVGIVVSIVGAWLTHML